MKILWRIMYNLFIASKTQSWIYKSYVYLMKFAGCFDLPQNLFLFENQNRHKLFIE